MKICYSCFEEYDDRLNICPHCGHEEITEPAEPIYLAPGTMVANRYLVGEAVGAGGFGIVYKAWDSKLETIVAIKEFFVSRLVSRAKGEEQIIVAKKSQEEFQYRKERFLAEARNMAIFNKHRSIPNVYDYFEANGTAYIVMELLHGMPLNEYMKEVGGQQDPGFAMMVANEIGNALESLHEHNIIHRDVAPDNIYICSDKEIRIKLMDLGAAKLADATDDVIDIILKPGYSPTEQYDNSKNIGPWTDIYALGATLYVMLTGIKPDESTNRKIVDTVVPPNQINPLVPDNLSNAIMKAMAVDVHMRFKTVKEFLSAINGEKEVATLEEEKKKRKRNRILGIVAASLVVALIAGYVITTFMGKKAKQELKEASISVWFSVAEGSTEETAMKSVINKFQASYPTVKITYRAIEEASYQEELEDAAASYKLPTLFESTGASDKVLLSASDVSRILQSEQAAECRFLDQYSKYYSQHKQIPLGIEVPVAYVITGGAESLTYDTNFFTTLGDFGTDTRISADDQYLPMLSRNFGDAFFGRREEVLDNEKNTGTVLLSSTMALNEVLSTLTNYEKKCVYYAGKPVACGFVYEWSIGKGSENQIKAAERLLEWMLGSDYQNDLMVSGCSDGQLPVNATVFDNKIKGANLAPIANIFEQFSFDRSGKPHGLVIEAELEDAVVMSGDTVTLRMAGNDEVAYQWESSEDGSAWEAIDGATEAVLEFEADAEQSGTMYRCQVTLPDGNTITSKEVTMSVVGIVDQSGDIIGWEGDKAEFYVQAVGDVAGYQWQISEDEGVTWESINKEKSPSAGESSRSFKVTAKMDGRQYRCIVTYKDGNEVISKPVHMQISGIKTQPISVEVHEGDPITTSVEATGDVTAYQWQLSSDNGKTWSNIDKEKSPSAGESSRSFNATVKMDGRQYRCVVTYKDGKELTSDAMTITVTGIKTHPSDVSVAEGGSVKFSIEATGKVKSYQWQYSRDGKSWIDLDKSSFESAATRNLQIKAQSMWNGYVYRCVVTYEDGGTVASNTAKLTVK